MTNFEKQVEQAKKYLASESCARSQDWTLAVYIIRDYQELRDMDLTDLAWSMCRQRDSPKNEVEWFFEEVEKKMEEAKGG